MATRGEGNQRLRPMTERCEHGIPAAVDGHFYAGIGENFSGADLNRANLTGANLTEANLFSANLHGANRHTAMLPRRSSGVRISPASVNTASIQTTRAPALPLKSAQGWPPDAQQQGN